MKMGTGVDPTMDRKIPTTLWKTQLMKLVSEAPKALCVECTELGYQRFPSSSSTSGDDSDQSIGSGGSVGGSEFSCNQVDLNGRTNHDRKNKDENNTKNVVVVDSLASLEIECMNMSLKIIHEDSNSEHSHSPSPQMTSKKDVVMRNGLLVGVVSDHHPSNGSGTTAAAPWHRPSIYLFNPFGKAFHGYLSHSETNNILAKDGQFLVRKREKDNDDDFVLTFRFNGHIKNFLITFDDTSGLIYVGDRDKGYETLQELVQEGMITMYLDHKAGPYIDLMCDLTRYRYNASHQLNNYNHGGNGNHSNNGSINGHLFTMNTGRGNVSSKQNSPSPSVSSLRSSMERQRNPELRTQIWSHSFQIHTFQDLSQCQICQNFLWGLSSQGLLCQDCGFIIHESCLERVITECEPRLSQLTSVFGADLTVLVKATGGAKPPFVLEKCITEIEERGLHIEGIYRVSGSRELTERLKTLLEQEREGADLKKHADIHSMCGLVKFFLRNLPTPLITKELFQRFLNAAANGPLTVEIIRRNLKKSPPAHYITLKYVLQHLHRVAEASDRNKMNPFNLSSVFAPSLLCPQQISMETLKVGTSVINIMITQVPNLFPKS